MKINLLSKHVTDLRNYVLEECDADEIWYWYETEPYEGMGWLVARKGNKYGTVNLGHCSCFGPEDIIPKLEYNYGSIEEMKARHSKEAWNEIGL